MPRNSLIAIGQWKGETVSFRRDRLIVSVAPGPDVAATLVSVLADIQTALGDTPTAIRPPRRRWAIVSFPARADAETRLPALAEALSHRPDLRYAEPDFIVTGHLAPSDPDYALQYKSWANLIGMEEAWEITQGSDEVLITILDSGICIPAGKTEPEHDDLDAARFVVAHADAAGTAVHHDYVDGDRVPKDGDGHGTHITGIIAASANNKSNIAGVNWKSNVYVARVLDDTGIFPTGSVGDVKLAVEDLADYASMEMFSRVVVNMSFGSTADADSMREMCKETDTGVFVICVGPGMGSKTDVLDYPGAYAASFGHVIAVGACDKWGVMQGPPGMSSYAAITVFAPGMGIPSIAPTYKCRLWDPADPGFVSTPELSGTSQAAAIVSGVVSLMWSANGKLTPKQIKDCLLHTAVSFVDLGETGWRIHAGDAVRGVAWTIALDTPYLYFVDVAEGAVESQHLVFTIASCTALTFEIVSGSDAGLPASFTIADRDAAYDPETDGDSLQGIEVSYTAGAAGSVALGEFRVRCVESGEEWTVGLIANTVSPSRAAVVLVADASGSMSQASGVDSLTRMDVLHVSSEILVDVMRVGDALGVVKFEEDAAGVAALTGIAGEATTSAERVALKNAIATLVPGGATSIGDGVVLGNAGVAGAVQDRKALLVVTDGHENTAEFIADVMGEVDVPVYAIGMGTAEVIQPESLAALTASTGGYVVLTGTMDGTMRYKLAKYMVQMLAGASGTSLILDPSGYLHPGMVVDIPFTVCGEDRAFATVLMTAASPNVRCELVSPDGVRVGDDDLLRGVRFVRGRQVCGFRVSLPLDTGRAREHAGTWHALLKLPAASGDAGLHGPPPAGAAYQFMVMAESNLGLQCRATASGHAPGSTVVVRASLSCRGLALAGASVHARVRAPDGSESHRALAASGNGPYEGAFAPGETGVYEIRVRAHGHTPAGDPFTREQTVTAHIWQAVALDVARMRAREIARGTHTR